MVALIINSRVVRVVVGGEYAMFDEWSDTDRSKRFAEAHGVIAFVGGETPKVACVPQSDLRADPHPTRPLRAAVQVEDRSFGGVD